MIRHKLRGRCVLRNCLDRAGLHRFACRVFPADASREEGAKAASFAAAYFEGLFEICYERTLKEFDVQGDPGQPCEIERRKVILREGREADLSVVVFGDPLSIDELRLLGEIRFAPDLPVGYFQMELSHGVNRYDAFGGFFVRFPGMGIGSALVSSVARALGSIASQSGRSVYYYLDDGRATRESAWRRKGCEKEAAAEASIIPQWDQLFRPGGKFDREVAAYRNVFIDR